MHKVSVLSDGDSQYSPELVTRVKVSEYTTCSLRYGERCYHVLRVCSRSRILTQVLDKKLQSGVE